MDGQIEVPDDFDCMYAVKIVILFEGVRCVADHGNIITDEEAAG